MKLVLNLGALLAAGALAAAGCSSSGSSSGGSGGSSAKGGSNGSGGSSSASGGTHGSGGASASGGNSGSGSGGTNGSGGGAASGGSNGSGGASASGGTHGSGGASGASGGGTGGSLSTGGSGGAGAAGSGGTADGGTSGSGGAGGKPATGTGGSGGTSGGGSTGAGGVSSTDGGVIASPMFDWVGVIGTGQSLSVGTTPASSTTQPYNNMMLDLGAATVPGTGSNPWDPTVSGLSMVPLVEPVRALETAYPSPYPGNIYGETPHAALANELTSLVKASSAAADYITVHTIVGESGQGVVALVKQTGSTTGTTGRAYAASLFEVGAITRLAKAAGKSYGVGVIVMTHGETDCNNATYGDSLTQLLSDYNTDIAAVTGQTYQVPMYLSQQHGCPGAAACTASTDTRPTANDFEWQLGVEHPGQFVCTGPKYQYPVNADNDGIHLDVTGYQMLGERVAEVYYQRQVLGQDWQPLMPISVSRSGQVVTVQFHVPVPPLNWDTSFDAPKIAEFVNGKGFELYTASGNIMITSVAISGDSVQITAGSTLPTTGLTVAYALINQGKQLSNHSKAVRWGQLRDSDTFAGSITKMVNPNYAVSFSQNVP